MTVTLKKPTAACIPVHLTDRDLFTAHAAALPPAQRQWLATLGFNGAPDTHALLPDEQGRLQAVWAGVRAADHPWALAALPRNLPAGRYRLGSEGLVADAQAAAMSWQLGAYAFSRYSFLGDKHLFFWLLTNRMTPPAVFLLPFFQLYTTLGLMDTHLAVAMAHLVFSVPLAVWILEGFMSGIPREIDETAYIDGYSFPRFFLTIFLPLIKAGVGVAAFFCFMFSWVELLLARTLTSVNAKPIVATMTRTVSASGMDWATLAAAGTLTIVPGAIVIWFVRHYIAKGFAMGRV